MVKHQRLAHWQRCAQCDGTFPSARKLAAHVAAKHGRQQFCCLVPGCGKSFTTKKKLGRHRKSHTRPHQCKHCSKAFGSRDGLRRHERTHTGEKPYACPCGRRFADPSTMRRHFRRMQKRKDPKHLGAVPRPKESAAVKAEPHEAKLEPQACTDIRSPFDLPPFEPGEWVPALPADLLALPSETLPPLVEPAPPLTLPPTPMDEPQGLYASLGLSASGPSAVPAGQSAVPGGLPELPWDLLLSPL